MDNFSEWLIELLEERGWSRSEAARRGQISPSMFDKVINQYANPGIKFCMGVARAFDIPLQEVLIRAGLDSGKKNPKTVYDISDEIISHKISELSENQKDELLQFIEFIQDRDDRAKKKEFIERHTRETEKPPE